MTSLDAILSKVMELNGASALFVARQKVLLVHKRHLGHTGTWVLPDLDVAGDAQMDAPVPLGDVLFTRCGAEFNPVVDDEYEVCWERADRAVGSPANDPRATAAIEQFLATHGNSQAKGELKMESRLSPRDAQLKAQQVCEAFGDAQGAPGLLNGESGIEYRIRLLSKYQVHSKIYKDADLSKIGDPTVFTAIEDAIYADALHEAAHPTTSLKRGELRAIIRKDGAGRSITSYVASDDGALWDRIAPPIRYAIKPKWLGMAAR